MRRAAIGILAALACAAAGCDTGRAFTATPNDYADYRQVRVAGTFDERMAAMWRYVTTRPKGRFAAELRAEIEATEPIYYKARSQSPAGLNAYLAALPEGPHAKDAHAALLERRADVQREAQAEQATHAMMRRIDAEERGRKGVAGLVEWWVRALLDPAPWHGTFSDAPPELLARFRMAAPEPRCTSDEDGQSCEKKIVRTFRVRHESGEVDRELAMTITIQLDPEYHLERATLAGPGLGLRTEEAALGEASDGDRKAATAAWQALVDRLNKAIIADNRICNGGQDDTGTLALRCDDPAVSLTVAPGTSDMPDTVTIVRVK